MAICEHCGAEIARGKWCSDKCRMAAKRRTNPNTKPEQKANTDKPEQKANKPVVSNSAASLIAEARGRAGHRLMPEDVESVPDDQMWRYTRHLNPEEAAKWFRVHRPQWCSTAKPGEPDYPQECIGGVCQTCGADTELKSITCCHACVSAKYKEAV